MRGAAKLPGRIFKFKLKSHTLDGPRAEFASVEEISIIVRIFVSSVSAIPNQDLARGILGKPAFDQRQKQVGTRSQTILPGASGNGVNVIAEFRPKERGVASSVDSRGGNKPMIAQNCKLGGMKKKVENLREPLFILSHHASTHVDQSG